MSQEARNFDDLRQRVSRLHSQFSAEPAPPDNRFLAAANFGCVEQSSQVEVLSKPQRLWDQGWFSRPSCGDDGPAIKQQTLQDALQPILKALRQFVHEMTQTPPLQNGLEGHLRPRQADTKHAQLREWLECHDSERKQLKLGQLRLENTCDWVTQNPVYRSWISTPLNSLLWIKGRPGTGKTFLMSRIIDEVRKCANESKQLDGHAVAFYYFDSDSKTTVHEATLSLFRQLFQSSGSFPDDLVAQSELPQGSTPSAESFSSPPHDLNNAITRLLNLVRDLRSVTVCIDALDECDDLDNLLRLLSQLSASTCRVVVSCRPSPKFQSVLRDAQVIEIEQDNQEDIALCIQNFLEGNPRLSKLMGRVLLQEAKSWLQTNSSGSFLWAGLQGEELLKLTTRYDIRKHICQPPSNEAETYKLLLRRISEQHESRSDLAKRTLAWLSVGIRPMTLLELQDALSIYTVGDDPNSWVVEEDRRPPAWAIEEACMGLVVIDSSDTVRLSHLPATEYLIELRQELFPTAQDYVARCCLEALRKADFGTGPCHDKAAFDARLRKSPCAIYATENWGSHLHNLLQSNRRSPPTINLMKVAYDLLKDTPRLSAMAQIMHRDIWAQDSTVDMFPDNFTPLHIAAYFNMADIIPEILADSDFWAGKLSNVDVKDTWGRTAFHLACMKNHAETFWKLLAEGTNINEKDSSDRTPLYVAVMNGNEQLAQELSKRGGHVLESAAIPILNVAAERGHCSLVEMLIENQMDGDSRDALRLAVEHGHFEVMRLLLRRGNRGNLNEALLEAASQGASDAIIWLFENGADLSASDADGRTPLHRAVLHDHVDLVDLIVHQLGAGVEVRDVWGRTPLFSAMERGNVKSCRMLHEAGADLNATDAKGRTPLLIAAKGGHVQAMKLVLDLRADLDAVDNQGRTPLMMASQGGHVNAVELLLNAGANTNARDGGGQTPLMYAARAGHVEVVKLLLDLGANPNAADNQGRTPLTTASQGGQVNTFELLLNAGANPDTRDGGGQTPLMYAARAGHMRVVGWLLVHGIGIDDVDDEDQMALSMAVEQGLAGDIVRLLKGLRKGSEESPTVNFQG